MARFLCSVDYGDAGHEVLVEVWLENDEAPGDTDRDEVEEALRQIAASGEAPGWRVSAVRWHHPKGGGTGGGAAKLGEFDAVIRSSQVNVGPAKRRPRKKKGDEEEDDDEG